MKLYQSLKAVALILAAGAMAGFSFGIKTPQMNIDSQLKPCGIEEMVFDNPPMIWDERDIYAENNSSKEELEKVLSRSKYNKNRSFNLGNSEISYRPAENPIAFEGLATFYHTGHFPGKTATGAYFKDDLATIAINPDAGVNVPALVKLTNLDEESPGYGTTTLVIANDLGPWQGKRGHRERIVDMSIETKRRLGAEDQGILKVRAEVIKEYDLGKY